MSEQTMVKRQVFRKRPRFETTLAPQTIDFLRGISRAGVLIDELVAAEMNRRSAIAKRKVKP